MRCHAILGAGGPALRGVVAAAALLATAELAPLAAARDGGAAPEASGPASVAPVDTILAIRRGEVLVLENLSGGLRVGTWDRPEVQIESDRRNRVALRTRRSGDRIVVRGSADRGGSERADWVVRMPAWARLEVTGHSLDATVDGVRGGVDVQVLEGDVLVRNAAGGVTAASVEGLVRVESVEGRLEASSVDDGVVVRGVRGDVTASSVDGDVVLDDVEGRRVEATTVDGDVTFEGRLAAGAELRLVTHDGDVTLAFADVPAARFTVSTFDGDFQSDFPVTMERFMGGKEFGFSLGAGSARVVVEAFDGSIRLLRRP